MTSNACTARLQKELKELSKNPLPMLRALPSPSSLLEWHYVLEGAADSPYAGGYYHGKIVFPSQYPFKPPAIIMLTPSGRFEPGAKICLSLSDFHPESWNPLWGVGLILLGLQSFFYENVSTTGAVHGISAAEKKRLASKSLLFNVKNPTFRKLFPELVEAHEERVKQAASQPSTAAIRSQEGGGGVGHDGVLDEAAKRQLGWRDMAFAAGVAMVAMAIGFSVIMPLST